MKITLKFLLISGLILAFCTDNLLAQCMMYPVSLSSRIANATCIVEGKVVAQVSFRDPVTSLIYTSSTVDVYKIFKGPDMTGQLEIITEGGVVGNYKHVVEPSLTLGINDIGTFFLEPATTVKNTQGKFPVNLKFIPYFPPLYTFIFI